MKTNTPKKKDNPPKNPKFFDHLFYWLWHYTRHGFPDRSFVTISVIQLACLLFPVAVTLQFISIPAIHFLYEADSRLTILPAMVLFLVLIWKNGRIYTDPHYHMIQHYYGSLPASKQQYHHRRFLVCMATAATIIALDVWLFIRYGTRCEILLRAHQLVTAGLHMKP